MDRRGVLHFAPLQGRAAQAFLRARGLPTADFDSLILVPEWTNRATAPFLLQTDGALVALRATGGARCGLAALGGLFPAAWRDALYRRVAANRKRLGGPGMVALPAERMLP
jgi:predicted DCC family thiol-disulfide oxidoreductase YuxK